MFDRRPHRGYNLRGFAVGFMYDEWYSPFLPIRYNLPTNPVKRINNELFTFNGLLLCLYFYSSGLVYQFLQSCVCIVYSKLTEIQAYKYNVTK